MILYKLTSHNYKLVMVTYGPLFNSISLLPKALEIAISICYKEEGFFFCHKCKKTVDIYPLWRDSPELRFQIYEPQKCYYYKLIDEEVDGIKLISYKNGKFKRRDGTWKKFAKDTSSIENNFLFHDKIGHNKYGFYCCNCKFYSTDFYAFIPLG